MCRIRFLPSVVPVERHEEGMAMRMVTSFMALAIVAVGGAPATAPARPIDTAIVRVCETTWPTPTDIQQRATAAMLPTYGVEPTAYRAEATLSIEVAGVRRPVAAGIGVASDATRISALHTKACDGVLHVVAAEAIQVHLWQLFEEWDVRLTQHCIGESCDAAGVRITLDGEAVDMCPGAIPIEDGTSIELSLR
jgi:hypothetical protein